MIKKNKIGLIFGSVADYKVFICKALDTLYPDIFYALHGQERPGTTPRDVRDLPIQNNINIKNKYWVFKGIELTWMPVIWWFLTNRPRVLILGDGARMIHNYLLHFLSKLIGAKVIYYTHGYNHQAVFDRSSTVESITERMRRFYFACSDALIVYTQANKSYLENVGVKTKIFVSHNTLDTPKLLERQANVSNEVIKNLKQSYGIKENQHVIVYLGRMVPEKEVHLFIELMRQLCESQNDRYFGIAIGDGLLLDGLKELSKGVPIHFTGHITGQKLSDHLACADCMFIPSHVGLAVIEAFCAELPFITCEDRHHSPEVDYIQNEVNGLILESADPQHMALKISQLVEDEEALNRMSAQALKTAHTLHPDNSIKAFVDAINYVNLGELAIDQASNNR